MQPPGLEEGSEPCTTVEGLAAYFAEQLKAFRPQAPVALAGYCAGGTIAFELARQLQASGTIVTELIMFGAPYRSYYRFLSLHTDHFIDFCIGKTAHIRRLLGLPVTGWKSYLADLSEARFDEIRHASHDSVMIRRRSVEKATIAAIRRYTPGSFDGHMNLMVPSESWGRSWAKPLRWSKHAANSTTLFGPDDRDCNGDTMLFPEYVETFASAINHPQASSRHAARQ